LVLDATHDPTLTSWVSTANAHPEFPIQNLPIGVFSLHGGAPRGGVAIGDAILDLAAVLEQDLLTGPARDAAATAVAPTLNAFLALGAGARQALRQAVSTLLAAGNGARMAPLAARILHRAVDCTPHLPAAVGDYTDFYAGIHHATNAGRLLRPDNPLMPNYKYVPVAYHGRASSVCVSGTPVRRPQGQRKRPQDAAPTLGPCRDLDYELELGVWIGTGNQPGTPIALADAPSHIAGLCLLNDWSARDLQSWESQPLGPFLAKSFLTSVSPWIVTPEALEPFRVPQPPRPKGDPAPLPYLRSKDDQTRGAYAIACEVLLLTPALRKAGAAPHRLSRAQASDLYWTVAQMVAHHTVNGCNLRPGDLFGTGTVSAAAPDGCGCLLELTRRGQEPVRLSNGETRAFLRDGDEVILRAHCSAPGRVAIGFGECRGTVMPAA
jgi:fumarylacetoacetase